MMKEERSQRNRELWKKWEKEAQLEALRQIRNNPQAAPRERLEAVKLLLALERQGYSFP